MIDHISLGSKNYQTSLEFYDAALSTLGYVRLMDMGDAMGYGLPDTHPTFWISQEVQMQPSQGFHLAFTASSQQMVDAFYAAALAHGGSDNGAPGLRTAYSPTYYAGFVISPEGHHLEAVYNR